MLRISDVTFLVRDLDEAIAFFVDAIGFAVRQDEVVGGSWRRVVVGPDDGGTGLVLVPTTGDVLGRQADGDVALFLETDDFAVQHARMLAHGVVFREEPRHEPYGTVAVFEDLHGMPWDLVEPPLST
ncbi:VOC family protein [Cellulosimicrobium sp. NPDC057862]|uniref:VOC family protein n=1 Tax=Actinomycetes TaxID=1760 RepID=UPI00366F62A8